MSKESKLNRFLLYVTALGTLTQSITISGATRPGDLDPSFDPGSGVAGAGNALVVQEDRTIIIGGGFTNFNGAAVANIARLHPDGSLDTNYLGAGGGIGAMQRLADAKLLVGGHFSEFGGVARDQIAKLNADGSVDPTFVPQGGFKGYYSQIFALATQPDGKVIAGGTFELTSATNVYVVRLQSDGSLDPGFFARDLGSVLALAVQPDGKILMGGTFGIRRVNADGTPDASFGPVSVSDRPGIVGSVSVHAVHLYQDGRILIGGYFVRVNGELRNHIARLTSAGVLDAGFDPGTGADGRIRAIVVQPNGQIIVGGSFSNFNEFPRLQLARLLPDGTVDLGFRCDVDRKTVTNRNPFFDGPYALGVQADGKVVFTGVFNAVNGAERPGLARIFAGDSTEEAPRILTSPVDLTVSEGTNLTLNADLAGVPFPSIQWLLKGSAIAGASGHTLRLQNVLSKDAGDYTITLSNNLGVVTGLVARLTVLPASSMPGAADVSFGPGDALENPRSFSLPGGPMRSWIKSVAAQSDGKILAVGTFSSFDGALAKGLVRLNGDGGLDRAFLSNAIAVKSDLPYVDDVLVQPDGKILIAGNYSRVDGGGGPSILLGRLSRLNVDGTIDASFIESVEADQPLGSGFRIALRPDGKILLSGGSARFSVGETFRRHLTLLNHDGSLDPAFNPDAGIFQGQIIAMCIQNDGRAVIGGGFSMFSGVPHNYLVRLNPDGNLDASFVIGSGPDGWVYALRVQTDGKILVGGSFSTFAGVSRNGLARLSADGSLDMSFDPVASVVGTVQSIDLQPDGKILVAGGRYPGIGSQTNNVVRLLPDGTLDTAFDTRTDDVVYDLVHLDDGRIAVGGAFSRLDNVLRNGIAVLHGDPLLMNPSRTSEWFGTGVKTVTGRNYRLEYRSSLYEDTWTPLQETAGSGEVITLTDPNPNSPQRFYRVRVD